MAKIPKNTKIKTLIYTLEDPDTNEIRYVGKTIKSLSNRLTHHIYSCKRENNHRTNWIKSILKRDKKPIIKMIDFCPWDKSQELEIYWISKFKEEGFNLVNMSNGGEGNIGLKLSQKVKDNLLLAVSKKIYQYDLDGNFIKEFKNAVDASKYINFKSISKINSCANRKRNKAGNFQWSYIKKEFLNPYKREKRIIPKNEIDARILKNSIPIYEYSLDNVFIKKWDSAKVIAKTLNICYTSFISHLNKKRNYNNEKILNSIWIKNQV